jgi:hypothetical protein
MPEGPTSNRRCTADGSTMLRTAARCTNVSAAGSPSRRPERILNVRGTQTRLVRDRSLGRRWRAGVLGLLLVTPGLGCKPKPTQAAGTVPVEVSVITVAPVTAPVRWEFIDVAIDRNTGPRPGGDPQPRPVPLPRPVRQAAGRRIHAAELDRRPAAGRADFAGRRVRLRRRVGRQGRVRAPRRPRAACPAGTAGSGTRSPCSPATSRAPRPASCLRGSPSASLPRWRMGLTRTGCAAS